MLSLNATSIKVLRVISKFIDDRGQKDILIPEEYYSLQKKVLEVSPKNSSDEKSNLQSIRKEINQFVKLGFVDHQLRKKHPLTNIFLKSFDDNETYIRRQKITIQFNYGNTLLHVSIYCCIVLSFIISFSTNTWTLSI